MKPEPDVFHVPDEEHDARRLAEALVDVAAGRVISHEAMKAWLLSWGTADELARHRSATATFASDRW